jgi:hypothetical protein
VSSEQARVVHRDRDPAGRTGIDTNRDDHARRVCHSTSLATINGVKASTGTR